MAADGGGARPCPRRPSNHGPVARRPLRERSTNRSEGTRARGARAAFGRAVTPLPYPLLRLARFLPSLARPASSRSGVCAERGRVSRAAGEVAPRAEHGCLFRLTPRAPCCYLRAERQRLQHARADRELAGRRARACVCTRAARRLRGLHSRPAPDEESGHHASCKAMSRADARRGFALLLMARTWCSGPRRGVYHGGHFLRCLFRAATIPTSHLRSRTVFFLGIFHYSPGRGLVFLE